MYNRVHPKPNAAAMVGKTSGPPCTTLCFQQQLARCQKQDELKSAIPVYSQVLVIRNTNMVEINS